MTVNANSNLEILNASSEDDAKEELARCCGASRWVEKMMARRPFYSVEELFSAADDIWLNLLPKIGWKHFRITRESAMWIL